MTARIILIAAGFAFFALPAEAEEELVAGVSQDAVQITSNYTGTDLVVFGAIESRPQQETPSSRETVVVVVRGPEIDMTVRRKDRVAGIWVNTARARLDGMPSYYFLAGTRPLSEAASADTLKSYDLGLANLRPERVLSDGNVEPFRQALIRRQRADGLYSETQYAVQFHSPALFSVHVPIPASVPRGQYNVQVYLFRDGSIISAQSIPLFIEQVGIERRVYLFAHEWPLSYGVSAVLMALSLGWLSTVVFRRRAG
jgi:uncharacterized protein (TIGR02186 family)